jgi:ATP-binding cassette subfamily B multidrug efflux pump
MPRRGGVLRELQLNIAPGERVGLVGRSGAGKSTLVHLLLGFYRPERGRILIDGRDIAGLTQESLRAQIGMVTQDTSLLHRSIRDNIRYGRPEASEAEIVDAARRANALEFIEGLEDWHGRTAFDAHVGERGVKLSGGQRQRIALARVILKNAPILVLDEATSALDSEVEAAIEEGTHEALLAARGHYAALWRRQSGGFRMDLPGGERGDALVAVRA